MSALQKTSIGVSVNHNLIDSPDTHGWEKTLCRRQGKDFICPHLFFLQLIDKWRLLSQFMCTAEVCQESLSIFISFTNACFQIFMPQFQFRQKNSVAQQHEHG